MKLIIDISEEIYKHVDTIQNGSIGAKQIINSVKNGIPAYKAMSSVEPKTGRWIQTNEFFINQDGQFIYKFICSECKSLSYFRKSNKKAIGANVCPNCGAKMVERSEV